MLLEEKEFLSKKKNTSGENIFQVCSRFPVKTFSRCIADFYGGIVMRKWSAEGRLLCGGKGERRKGGKEERRNGGKKVKLS
jgi:hypothetical protein